MVNKVWQIVFNGVFNIIAGISRQRVYLLTWSFFDQYFAQILFKPLATFPYNHRRNKVSTWEEFLSALETMISHNGEQAQRLFSFSQRVNWPYLWWLLFREYLRIFELKFESKITLHITNIFISNLILIIKSFFFFFFRGATTTRGHGPLFMCTGTRVLVSATRRYTL